MNFSSIEQQGNRLTKTKAVQLDFSAVAKGYGVDALAKLLRDKAVSNYMVEVGGELATLGHNSRGHKWKIGIEKPEALAGVSISVLRLNKAHVATSGDYRNYFEIDGRRYSHTIDPRTAKPINHKLSSVTVVADSVAEADAWATALSVLGEVEGLALAKQLNLAALFIYKQGDDFSITVLPEMQQYLR
jgi:thiamine biosynthesis lipoprotein